MVKTSFNVFGRTSLRFFVMKHSWFKLLSFIIRIHCSSFKRPKLHNYFQNPDKKKTILKIISYNNYFWHPFRFGKTIYLKSLPQWFWNHNIFPLFFIVLFRTPTKKTEWHFTRIKVYLLKNSWSMFILTNNRYFQ